MTNNPKDMLDKIPIPNELDERIELGFEDARKYKNVRRNKFKKSFVAVVASLFILIGSLSLIGFDKVEAAIKQVLQYVPGYNVVLESDDGGVLVLKDKVLYEKDDIYVNITAASKLNENFNISVQSNYMIPIEDKHNYFEDMKVSLEDETGNIFTASAWSGGGGGDSWSIEYFFEIEDESESNNYSLLVNDIEVPFTLEKGTEVEDFFQLGNHASDKGIDIVAIKKPLEDRLMISLLHQSENKTVVDYPFENTLFFADFSNEQAEFESSMYIVDKEGNKTYPTIPSSFGNLMSDFYFDMEDKEGLKLILPYIKVKYTDVKSDKIRIQTPSDGETIEINEVVALGDFQINVLNARRKREEIIIRYQNNSLEDEKIDSVFIGGIDGFGLSQNPQTGVMNLSINAEDVGRSFSIYFERPEIVLLGDWVIDLD